MMSIVKRVSRKYLFPVAMLLGTDKLLRSLASNSVLNIMYHGVVRKNSSFFSPRHIPESQFEQHLKYYKKNFKIISLSESFKNPELSIDSSKKIITISFDDGFKNNLEIALPLLEKYEIPVTFFVSGICTENVDDCFLWTEMMAGLQYFCKDKMVTINGVEYVNLYNTEKGSLVDFLKSREPQERDRILAQLSQEYDLENKIKSLPGEIWRLLNKDDLKRLSQSGLADIGSHGHLHYNLGQINARDAKRELVISKEKLENTVGNEVTMIAYPDGSYNEEIKDMAESVGYRYQLAVNYLLDSDESDIRIQNRHGISATTTFESNMLTLNRAFRHITT